MGAQIMIRVLVGINETSNPFEPDHREVLAVSPSEDALKEYLKEHYDESCFSEYEIVRVPFIDA